MIAPLVASILTSVASSAIQSAFAPRQQPEQPQIGFQRRQRTPFLSLAQAYGGGGIPAAPVPGPRTVLDQEQSPIAEAFGPPLAAETVEEKTKKGAGIGKDILQSFLGSLTSNLAQRVVFGGQQQTPTYSPPIFR